MSIRVAAVAVAVVLAAVASVAAPAPAAAATPCWKRLVNDWYDGRIDRAYPVKCYRTALKNLPEDVENYADAEDQIRRALLAATRRNSGGGGTAGSAAGGEQLVPPPKYPQSQGGGGGERTAAPDAEEEDGGVIGNIFDAIRPNNADSVPLPLLVLAGLAFVLLGSALAGFVAKRIQARRVALGPPPDDPPVV